MSDKFVLTDRPYDEPGNIFFMASGSRLILTMKPDGTIEIGKGFTPTEAASEFLKVLAELWPQHFRQGKP